MNELVESDEELNEADLDEELPESEEEDNWDALLFNEENQKSFIDSEQE